MTEQEPTRDEQEVTFVAPLAGGTLRITGTLTVIPAEQTVDPDGEDAKKDGESA